MQKIEEGEKGVEGRQRREDKKRQRGMEVEREEERGRVQKGRKTT